MKIALSILTLDFSDVKNKFIDLANKVDYIHMDIMDAEFVPNISFGYSVVGNLRKLTDKPFDTHLMMMHPQNYIKQFATAGSQYITFHVEADCDPMANNCNAGISIKPNTTVKEIEKYLPYLDMVLVMSVEPGFGGQKFMSSAIDKVKLLKELKEKNNYNYLINIDGGINGETAPYISDYVDLAVSGSYICNADNPDERIEILKKL